ncbi:DUF5753 domain-containing protein [Streptomyces sp. NPDC049970]|uniref:DUF5753 domain-containing protein n=1 Tax=Streptomyces sp. NPDC049970 TaxID=3155033 RepID=UPI003432A96E
MSRRFGREGDPGRCPAYDRSVRVPGSTVRRGVLRRGAPAQKRVRRADAGGRGVILSEGVMRCAVGGPDVMAEQLRHLAALGRSGRVLVQVLPHGVGAHATMNSMVCLMRFADAPDLAYVEGLYTGALTDDPPLVRRYRDACDLARAAALPPVASLDLLESVAENYSHACTPDL